MECFIINKKQVIYDILQGNVVLLNIPKGTCYYLNETAGRIWEALEKVPTFQQLKTLFNFCTFKEEESIHEFLRNFEEEGLIFRSIVKEKKTSFKAPLIKHAFITPHFEVFNDLQSLQQAKNGTDPIGLEKFLQNTPS